MNNGQEPDSEGFINEWQQKQFSMYAFPGRVNALIGNDEQEVPTQGLTKREYFAMHFMASLSAEYVKRHENALIEIMASTAIKMADELLKQLES